MLIHWVLCGSFVALLKGKTKKEILVYFDCVKLLIIAHCSHVEVLPPKYICMCVDGGIKERKAVNSLKVTVDNKSIRNVSE